MPSSPTPPLPVSDSAKKPIWEIEPAFQRDASGRFFYDRGTARFPAMALAAIPFIFILNLFIHVKTISWPALLVTIVVFAATLGCFEHFSIFRGHWIYNEARMIGINWWGVPIEEWLIYYNFPIILVVSVLEFIANRFGGAAK